MPKPHQRTRARRRRPVKLPGSGASTHYKREKIGASHCVQCGRLLPSVPMLAPSKQRSLPASEKRLHRMYGGQLCHICLQEVLKQAIRSSSTS